MRNLLTVMVVALLAACVTPPQPGTGGGGGALGGGDGAGGGTASGGGGTNVGGGTASREDLLGGGSRLKVRSYVGSDGSRQQLGFFDTMRNEPCAYQQATDGTTRCMPSGLTSGAYFLDVGCNQAVFYRSTLDCSPVPTYALRSVAGSCSVGFEVHALGAALATPPGTLYFSTEAGCVQVTPISNVTYFPSTGVLQPTEFVQATVMVE